MKQNQRILVVDDEQDLLEILKFNLETEGYEVQTATSAEEAQTLDIASFDLLLLDVMMGGMSGFALARLLKANPKTASVPIIFLTARDTENDTVTGFNLGADDYIAKPFSLREVMVRVRAVLRRTAIDNGEEGPHLIRRSSNCCTCCSTSEDAYSLARSLSTACGRRMCLCSTARLT